MEKNLNNNSELEEFLHSSLPKICIIGVGGSGNNTIERITNVGVEGAYTVSLNTDAQALIKVNSDKKVLIGKKTTKGLGAGSNPSVGESAAEESKDELLEIIKGKDLVFVTCGLGGGTGTGAAPVTAKFAREQGSLTIGVATLPFAVEGKKRIENALSGLDKLKKEVDTLIIIPNDKILEIAPDLPLNVAFQEVDKILTEAVKGIIELITKAGIINLDFADLKTILSKGGMAMIGVGESTLEKGNDARAMEAVENALTSPLLDLDISSSNRALVNVIGGSDLTIKESELIVDTVASKINEDAHIIWGAMIDDNLENKKVKVMVVIAGAHIPYLEEGFSQDSASDDLEIGSV